MNNNLEEILEKISSSALYVSEPIAPKSSSFHINYLST